jgi:uncharacterized protein (DUF4415 family)
MTERERLIKSDLAKVDAHEPTPEEYQEAPEWTAEEIAEAVVYPAQRGRGRPPIPNRKLPVKLRLDPEVVEGFKATGPGWQTLINDTLRTVLKRDKSGRFKVASVPKKATRTKSKPTVPRKQA